MISGIITLSLSFIFIIIIYTQRENKNTKRILLLFMLYLLFGAGQQLFFQLVFLGSILNLFKFNRLIIPVFITSLYYALFHSSNPDKVFDKFFIGTFILNLFWSTIYLKFGNILWLALSHAILGTFYYMWIFDGDVMKKRLNLFAWSPSLSAMFASKKFCGCFICSCHLSHPEIYSSFLAIPAN